MFLAMFALAGCASSIEKHAGNATLLPADNGGPEIVLDQSVRLKLTGGVRASRLQAGSRWRPVGRVAESAAYRRTDGEFTVRTTHVHEAYLLIKDEHVVGVYLPFEHAEIATKQPHPLTERITR